GSVASSAWTEQSAPHGGDDGSSSAGWLSQADRILNGGARCPAPPQDGDGLFKLSATGSRDVWAVGVHRDNVAGEDTSLAEHFDGTTWRVVQVPNIGWLTSVLARAPTDVWMAGGGSRLTHGQPAFLHWNGSRWRVLLSPHVRYGGISAL